MEVYEWYAEVAPQPQLRLKLTVEPHRMTWHDIGRPALVVTSAGAIQAAPSAILEAGYAAF